MSDKQKYVDSFVMPVLKSRVDDYKDFAEKMAVLATKQGGHTLDGKRMFTGGFRVLRGL